jgi:hypothetical protein
MLIRVIRRACLLGLLSVARVDAQTPSLPGDKLGFDQAAASLADAQGYVYRMYLDGAATGAVLVATCGGTTSPFTCTAPLPALTTGTHTSQLTASVVLPAPDGRTIESAKSTALTFRLFAAPAIPAGQRIVP